MAKADSSPRVRLHAVRAIASRRPSPDPLTVALAADRLQYDDNALVREAAAVALATDPLGPPESDDPIAELAAWTVVANVLLNQDAVLVKD